MKQQGKSQVILYRLKIAKQYETKVLQVYYVTCRKLRKEHEIDQYSKGGVGHHGAGLLEVGFADHDHEAQVEAGEQGTQDEYYE